MALDGTVLDVPDSEENARVFGYPGSRVGTLSLRFPKFGWCCVIVAGTQRNCRCNNRVLTT